MSDRQRGRPGSAGGRGGMARLFMDALEDGGAGDDAGHAARPRLFAIAAATAALLCVAGAVGVWPLLSKSVRQGAQTARAPGATASAPPIAAAVPPPPVAAPPAAPVQLVPVVVAAPAPAANAPARAGAAVPPGATPAATPPAQVAAAAMAQVCAPAASKPSGTVTIQFSSSQHLVVTYDLTGLAPSCQFALGLFETTCQSHGALLASFPPATSTAGGTNTQTIASLDALGAGAPARSSIRLGAAATTSSASAETSVACANTQAAVDASNPSYRTHVS